MEIAIPAAVLVGTVAAAAAAGTAGEPWNQSLGGRRADVCEPWFPEAACDREGARRLGQHTSTLRRQAVDLCMHLLLMTWCRRNLVWDHRIVAGSGAGWMADGSALTICRCDERSVTKGPCCRELSRANGTASCLPTVHCACRWQPRNHQQLMCSTARARLGSFACTTNPLSHTDARSS